MIFSEVLDPGTTSSTLSTIGIPGLVFIVLVLSGVIIWQNKKIENLYKEKNDLQERRLQDSKERENKYNQVMGEFSRTTELLVSKLKMDK